MKRSSLQQLYRGSALIITLMFIVLLGLEALVVGLLLNRSTGTEAVLRGKNQSVRRASEIVLNGLSNTIYTDIVLSNLSNLQVWNKYKRGGSTTTYSTLTVNRYSTVNPESGAADQLNIDTAAWIQEYRGNYFHLVGRAKSDDVDLITHKWVLVKPCAAVAGTGVLTTIVSGIRYPGYNSTVVDPNTGRVFFGAAEDNYYSSSSLYSWLSSTGLSTIVSGRGGVGNRAIHMASDGRVFFGEYGIGDNFWTWKNGVLSTLVTGMNGAGRACDTCLNRLMYDSASDRIYWGTNYGGYTWTWKSNILSTVADDGGYITTMAMGSSDEAVYVYDTGSNYLLKRWTPSNQTETLKDLTAAGIATAPGTSNTIVVSGSNILFSEHSWTNNNRLFVYNRGSGITTQLPNTYYGGVWFWPMANGRIFLGDGYNPMHYWDSSSPSALTDILGSSWSGTAMNANRTLVTFANSGAGNDLLVWGPATGLSTISGVSGFTTPMQGTYDVDNDGNNDVQFWGSGNNWYNNTVLYFGESSNPGRFYQWDAATQALSTLMTGTRNVGVYGAVAVNSSGQVYFGSNTTSANSAGFYTYSPSLGLVTILTGRNYPGVYSTKINPITGGVYFGEAATGSNFYYYENISNCSTRPY